MNFYYYYIPRPFSRLEKVELIELAPEFKKYDI
jgi:hypothetical protein